MKVLIREKLSPHKSKTPEGYLICRDAIIARTGYQEYHKREIYPNWDGPDEIVKVMRDAKDVFSQEALASFENKPITCEHPDEDVTPVNYKDYAVGFVRDVHQGKVDGEDVMLANLVITDSDCINDIENGIRTDLSCGYNCDISNDKEPRQTNIRGNHVALCEQGRAGIARIVDSAEKVSYVKGLIFQSDTDIPAKSNLSFEEGLYKVGINTYVLIFHSGTHDTKQRELEKKYSAKNFESFSTSLIGDKIDTYDLRRLQKYPKVADALIAAATKYFETTRMTDAKGDDVDMPKLPARLKRKIQEEFSKKSTFVKDPDYDAYKFIKELGEQFYVDGEPLKFTREKINGWNKMGDGMMRKDYTFSVDGYDNTFRLSIYADPRTYETTEVNAYFLDSDTVSQTRENAIQFIKAIIDDPKNITEDSEGVRYLSQAAIDTIKGIAKFANLTRKDVENISREFFGPGGYSVTDSVKVTKADIVAGLEFAYSGNNAQTFTVKETPKAGKVKIKNPKGQTEIADIEDLVHDINNGDIVIKTRPQDSEDTTYDTYRGYDIDKVGEYFEVTFDGSPVQFETYDAALEYIDDQLARTESMLRDRAIRDREYSPYFKKELRKELARKKAGVEEEEAPDDEHSRLGFRKTKNSLLNHLKEFMKEARDE